MTPWEDYLDAISLLFFFFFFFLPFFSFECFVHLRLHSFLWNHFFLTSQFFKYVSSLSFQFSFVFSSSSFLNSLPYRFISVSFFTINSFNTKIIFLRTLTFYSHKIGVLIPPRFLHFNLFLLRFFFFFRFHSFELYNSGLCKFLFA